MPQGNLRLRAIVTGRVQEVGYRYFVQRVAVPLGLVGYVRNLSDGSVEVIASGTRSSVEQLIRQLWEGPSASRVEAVVTTELSPYTSEYSSFHVRF